MRQFVVIGHDAPTTSEFSLDDLAGAAGRLDVLCRCVNSAFFLSHALREDVRAHLVLGDEYTVTFDGATLKRLNPDERSTAALVRGALDAREEAIGAMPAESSPGVSIRQFGLEDLFSELDGQLIQLHEDGDPLPEWDPVEDPIFVLSDHDDFTETERSLLADRAEARIRLGPEPLHADHAITVAHHYLDTGGYGEF
jgi:tRNA (pseudouridine54-N1)-methyltransferase